MATFEKGHKKLGGKVKGVPNKVTTDIKQAFRNLVEGNLDNITKWMQDVAKDNPAKALEFMHQFAQYNVPLLARTQITGADDKKLEITVNHVGNKSESAI